MIDSLASQAVEKFVSEWPILSVMGLVFYWLSRQYEKCFTKLCDVLDHELERESE